MLKQSIYICFFIVFALVACTNNNEVAQQQPAVAGNTNLNAFVTELPEAPGYQAFKMNCTSCHSARYVQMQPDLPEKTWSTLVTKMQKTFGAPIADSTAQEIVKYLTTIKGK